jgi:hypothetical protein
MFFRKISETSTLSTLTSSWPSKVTYTYSTSNTFQQTLLPLCTQKVHYIVGTLIRDSDYKLLSLAPKIFDKYYGNLFQDSDQVMLSDPAAAGQQKGFLQELRCVHDQDGEI